MIAWRRGVAGMLVFLGVLLVVGCDGGGGQGEGPGRVALVIAQGGLGDESYNDLANKGFPEGLEENNLEGNTIESEDIVAQGELSPPRKRGRLRARNRPRVQPR